ncbi:helix-turn-helix domain-containing protein [Agathobaculum sp. Marseille-P7918]|uniref:helix-turn-helix domain-containing protein n=1 Tax=Agathobaculum sp. Marseille-P7918 TaxID=2479843 RepID=UPI000F642920|nr:helix-turn-helix transcriptional regulator [Agathobaculum sp. Marseille-P7918]
MNNLRTVRTTDPRKLTQKDVALFLGVDRSTYNKYETGDSEPNFETICRLSDFFDVSVEYLMGRPGAKKAPAHQEAGAETETAWDEIRSLLESAPPDKAEDAVRVVRALLSPQEHTK